MEVKIGVQNAPRELVVETDERAEDVEKPVAEAVAGERRARRSPTARAAGSSSPRDKLAYVEIGTASPGTVGFRS